MILRKLIILVLILINLNNVWAHSKSFFGIEYSELKEYSLTLNQRKYIESNIMEYYKGYYPRFFNSLFENSKPPDSIMPKDFVFKVYRVETDSIPNLSMNYQDIEDYSAYLIKSNKDFIFLKFQLKIYYRFIENIEGKGLFSQLPQFPLQAAYSILINKKNKKIKFVSGPFQKLDNIMKIYKPNLAKVRNDSTTKLYYKFILEQKFWLPNYCIFFDEHSYRGSWFNNDLQYYSKAYNLIDSNFQIFKIYNLGNLGNHGEWNSDLSSGESEIKEGYWPFIFENEKSKQRYAITKLRVIFDLKKREKITYRATKLYNINTKKYIRISIKN